MIGHYPKALKKFVNTRFRTIKLCLDPILYNFDSLAHYYSNLKKPTDRQMLLKTYFSDKRDTSRLSMLFIYAASEDLLKAIKFFEQGKVNIYNASEKLEKILIGQMRKIFDETELTKLNDEEVVKKSRHELMNLDPDRAKLLNTKTMFIGSETEKFIKELGLTPSSKQLTWFFDQVKRFHIQAVKRLQKYFATAF